MLQLDKNATESNKNKNKFTGYSPLKKLTYTISIYKNSQTKSRNTNGKI